MVPKKIIRQLIEGPLTKQHETPTVDNYTTHNIINIDLIPFEFPPQLLNSLKNIYIPTITNPSSFDKIIWGLSPTGMFTVKSLYHKLHNSHSNSSFRWIWALPTPLKLKHFIWLVSHHRLPTTSYLFISKSPIHLCATFAIEPPKISNISYYTVPMHK